MDSQYQIVVWCIDLAGTLSKEQKNLHKLTTNYLHGLRTLNMPGLARIATIIATKTERVTKSALAATYRPHLLLRVMAVR